MTDAEERKDNTSIEPTPRSTGLVAGSASTVLHGHTAHGGHNERDMSSHDPSMSSLLSNASETRQTVDRERLSAVRSHSPSYSDAPITSGSRSPSQSTSMTFSMSAQDQRQSERSARQRARDKWLAKKTPEERAELTRRNTENKRQSRLNQKRQRQQKMLEQQQQDWREQQRTIGATHSSDRRASPDNQSTPSGSSDYQHSSGPASAHAAFASPDESGSPIDYRPAAGPSCESGTVPALALPVALSSPIVRQIRPSAVSDATPEHGARDGNLAYCRCKGCREAAHANGRWIHKRTFSRHRRLLLDEQAKRRAAQQERMCSSRSASAEQSDSGSSSNQSRQGLDADSSHDTPLRSQTLPLSMYEVSTTHASLPRLRLQTSLVRQVDERPEPELPQAKRHAFSRGEHSRPILPPLPMPRRLSSGGPELSGRSSHDSNRNAAMESYRSTHVSPRPSYAYRTLSASSAISHSVTQDSVTPLTPLTPMTESPAYKSSRRESFGFPAISTMAPAISIQQQLASRDPVVRLPDPTSPRSVRPPSRIDTSLHLRQIIDTQTNRSRGEVYSETFKQQLLREASEQDLLSSKNPAYISLLDRDAARERELLHLRQRLKQFVAQQPTNAMQGEYT
ncbi:uncharacterized protein L969DRAFT_611599 [Mixia osmundae IAM 14324]|uniref:Uncharacterized protein n=1 Tax=Mixia osmundae (strain CBS 9802 / IAM 14324 / JCM 22182 / KY 12970) TaxID=764103 RepID=G7E2P2_MIXOS|nr:uncharacterized protein L969DRAFT_611599 [Mixia osmundae IAM 14324]KEI36967.1 hypothetical protein L969DRAFT_611599 [Mixia osmundae IAM 14324]GAA97102.1 hypothetical protein E5Q_03777 [Mixia osmundae IAM 14324]